MPGPGDRILLGRSARVHGPLASAGDLLVGSCASAALDLCKKSAKITLVSTSIGFSSTATSLMSGRRNFRDLSDLKRFSRESPWWDPEHNICGAQHSGTYAGY